MDLSEVCENLDQIALRYFEILEELAEHRRHLETVLKQGFFSLSKAKYSMGVRAVSPLQYDTYMNSLVSIQVRKENGTCSFLSHREKPGDKCRDECRGSESFQKEASAEKDTTQVRRRKAGLEMEDLSNRVQDLGVSKDQDEVYKDPLKWFGILVPAALRQSQSSFVSGIDDVTVLASLQNELMALQTKYKDLLKQKSELVKNLHAEKESTERNESNLPETADVTS